MRALLILLLCCTGCVDPDEFETVDAAPDAEPDMRRVDPPQPDAFVPDPDMAPADAAGDADLTDGGDAGPDGSSVDGGADALADAAPDAAPTPDMAPPPVDCDVELTVTLPADTPAGTLHVAGTFYANEAMNWNPGDPALTLSRAGDTATGTFSLPQGTRVEYKYTRGSWEAGESAADCAEVPNRTARVACADGPFRVVDVVVAWADTCQ